MGERILPGAVWKPISYRLDAPKFPAPPLGYIVHVPVSNGSLFNYFNGLRSPGRKFCTAWIPKAGHGKPEQYQSLDRQAWAQAAGNPLYWSFEVEGFPTEPMDDFQLDTLATWHKFLNVADRIATQPGQQGVGTHSMGGAAWGGHSCPGEIRTAQLPQILDRPAAPTGGFLMALSDQQQTDLYNRVMGGIPAGDVRGAKNPDGSPAWVLTSADGNTIVNRIAAAKVDVDALAAATAAKVSANASAADIAAELLKQITAPKES
jgi:hypothetical protein